MSSYTEYFTDILDLVISCNFEKYSEKKLFHIYIRKILIQSINFYKLFVKSYLKNYRETNNFYIFIKL